MAKASFNKPSKFLKKPSMSSVDPNSFRRFDRLLKVLRRLRPILVKDLDTSEILDRLSSNNDDDNDSACVVALSSEFRDFVVSLRTREERTLALLDRLEASDEAGVFSFVDAIRDRHRHLGSLLDKMITNYKSDDDDEDDYGDDNANVRERTAIAGEALRKILKNNCARRRFHPDGGSDPSAEVLQENSSSGDDDDDYLSCFVVSTRGKTLTERWIKHSDIRKDEDPSTVDTPGERTFMAVVTKDLVFRKTNPTSLPVHVKHPPINCRQVYVLDDDSKYSKRPDALKGRSLKGHGSRSANALRTDSFRKRQKEVTERILSPKTINPLPPPLPPKPENLPHLCFLSDGKQCWRSYSDSSTDPRDVLSSVESPLAQDSPSPLHPPHPPPPLPTRVATARNFPQSDDRFNNENLRNYSTKSSNSEENKANANSSVGSELPGKWMEDDEAEEGDDLWLNFAVEVEDPYESVGHPEDKGVAGQSSRRSDDDDPKHTAEGDNNIEPKAESVCLSGELNEGLSPDGCTSLQLLDLHSRLKSDTELETNDSNAVFPGKLNARDSGVDSVVSQGFPDSPFGPEPGAEHEVFPTCVLGNIKIPRSDEDSLSTDYSYYEDIEMFSGGPRSPSIYLDPNSSRSVDRRNTSKFPFEHLGDFTGTSPDQKVISCGSLLLVESDEVWSSAGDDEDSVNYRGSFLGYDKEGFAYYLPGDSLKRYGDPQDEDWFYPIPITPHEATIFLIRENQRGCFVVYRPRNCAPTGVQFLLSVCRGDGGVVHYSIVENVGGDFKVEGHDHTFMTLCELVSYFRRNQDRLAARLRRSLKDARMPITPGYHYPERLEISKSDIRMDGTISWYGKHGGMACHGQLNGSPVAVKVLAKDAKSMEDDDFLEEAQILMSIKHENIVRLVGLSCRSRPFYIVTEFFERGSLLECLQKNIIRSDSIEDLFDVCLQVVASMSYLEARQFILHRALAASNFLVTHNHIVKLTNFHRARVVLDDSYIACETEEVPVRWAAPEVLLESSYSTKSDVWAAGVVFWEVFSAGARPYAQLTDEETAVYVSDGGRLEKLGACTHDLFLLMKSCWRPMASERPSFRAIQEKFKGNSSVYYYTGQTQVPSMASAVLSSPPPPPPPPLKSSDVPQLPMKAKVTNPARLSGTPGVTTKTRHPSTMRESRSAEGGTLRTISENAKDYGLVPGGGAGAGAGAGAGGGGGGQLKVPGTASGRPQQQQQQQLGSSSLGGERVQTSSSDSSSVVSASVSNDFEKEDLSRGDKIRKSIRKLIIGKKTAK